MALSVVLIVPVCAFSAAQEQRTFESIPVPAASIESLNIPGGDAALPPISDSAIDVNSPFRQPLFRKGLALRSINTMRYAQNTLRAPVPADQQVYVGEHPFAGEMINPILTWDLRQIGLKRAQFDLSGVWQWVSWEPAGPEMFGLWTLNPDWSGIDPSGLPDNVLVIVTFLPSDSDARPPNRTCTFRYASGSP